MSGELKITQADKDLAHWLWSIHPREILEMAAQIIDQCNREGPYEAIGGAKRIRALIEEQKV